jgi:hypothetical protein
MRSMRAYFGESSPELELDEQFHRGFEDGGPPLR